uniref:ABC transporter domain-containing protein n=1 Tax=Oryza barthii TaxID=65489 RepID=A0A0D3EPJ5_9ORYZ
MVSTNEHQVAASEMEAKHLVEQLVGVTGDDHERFLLRIKNRFDRVGLELPTIEVRAEGLAVEAEAYTWRSPAAPTVFTSMGNTLLALANAMHVLPITWKTKYTILHETNAIIKPCRFCGIRKKHIAESLVWKVSGRVTYNGHGMEQFVPERTAAYISQEDLHAGEMTVRETLAFSARCLGTGDRQDLLNELTRREKEANVTPEHDIDMFMKDETSVENRSFPLEFLALLPSHTTVASESLCSLSSHHPLGPREKVKQGLICCHRVKLHIQSIYTVVVQFEKKSTQLLKTKFRSQIRIMDYGICKWRREQNSNKLYNAGEMLIGPARALFMDDISTGLDSSTAFQIVNFLRQMVHILGETAVISLLQPSQEMYDLFDDIIFLSEGHIVYQGPKEKAVDFFESLGFICPHRKAIADFLLEVTSRKDQQQYWSREDEPYRYFTVERFSEAFHTGQTITKVLEVPLERNLSSLSALETSKYGVRKRKLVKAIFSRELRLLRRNPSVYILTVLSFVAMTVFWHNNMRHDSVDDGGIYLGVLFFFVAETMFSNMCDLGGTIMKLPLFFKQRDVFYPAWAYTFPTWILKIPITLIQVTIWVTMTYYPIGFDRNIGRLAKHYFLLLALSQMSSSLFRLVAGVTRNMFAAKIFGTFTMLLLLLLSGFVVSSKNLNKFWMLGYWISPLMYAQNAISTNEFTAHSWSKVLPGSSESLGASVLKSRGLFLETKWYWVGLGALVGYTFLFNCLYTSSVSRRATLPFMPLSLTFNDIRYSVDMPKEKKVCAGTEDRLEILKGVSGAFRPGVLTALMGFSGAGKTTLMDVLAGRKTGGYTEGTINISGYPKKQETFSRVFGYCEQSNIHSPHLTMFVENVMELLELTSLQDAHVGLAEENGLSSEQRRRLTIAVELVANPSIIFMDEPTSGLDARGAAIVMRTVRNLVDTGKTIVCTIHQPSIDIFESLDEGIECVNRIKDGYNPATWMLEVTSTVQEQMSGIDFSEIYKKSELYQRNKALIEEISRAPANSGDLLFPNKYSQTFFKQCLICLWKQNLLYWRNIHYTGRRFFVTTVIALLFGTVFWNLGMKRTKPQDLFNSMGSMYSAVLVLGIQNASGIQPVIAMERIVFYRERASGMYSALPYAFAQVAIELPYVFVQTLIYGVLVYTMIGFEWTIAKFFWYLFFMYFTLLYFTFFGMMTVGIAPNGVIAAKIPIWWRWYYWICPVAWTLYGLGASQFGDVEEKLDTGETVAKFMRSCYGFKHEFLEMVAIVTMACPVAFAFLFGISLKNINFQKR